MTWAIFDTQAAFSHSRIPRSANTAFNANFCASQNFRAKASQVAVSVARAVDFVRFADDSLCYIREEKFLHLATKLSLFLFHFYLEGQLRTSRLLSKRRKKILKFVQVFLRPMNSLAATTTTNIAKNFISRDFFTMN